MTTLSTVWRLLIAQLNSAKDLGVTINNKLNLNAHISVMTGRAYFIHKCFISRNAQSLVQGFETYVRPNLEYASSTWSSSTISDIKTIESVQKRFTKRPKGLLTTKIYQNRLLALGLDSLEPR